MNGRHSANAIDAGPDQDDPPGHARPRRVDSERPPTSIVPWSDAEGGIAATTAAGREALTRRARPVPTA